LLHRLENTAERTTRNSPKIKIATRKILGKILHKKDKSKWYLICQEWLHIDDGDSFITATVRGGIKLLIDSGSKCNLLTDKTWKRLKDKKIQV